MVKYHITSKHLGVKYPCDQCDKIANSHGSLRKHKYDKHGGVKSDILHRSKEDNLMHTDEKLETKEISHINIGGEKEVDQCEKIVNSNSKHLRFKYLGLSETLENTLNKMKDFSTIFRKL